MVSGKWFLTFNLLYFLIKPSYFTFSQTQMVLEKNWMRGEYKTMLSLKEIHTQTHISNLFTSCGLCAITAIICTRNLHLFYFLIFYVIFPFSMGFMCLFSDLYIYLSFFSPPLHFLYLFISCLLYYSPGHISH